MEELQNKIDQKTKPLGALGSLEHIAFKIGCIQKTLNPELNNPHLLVFAADHGISEEGVSAYPSEVTYQMVLNFLQGGAAINIFCKQNNIKLQIIDAGVKNDFQPHPQLIIQKAGYSSRNILYKKAMSKNQLEKSLEYGAKTVKNVALTNSNIIGFGEMGIGNTSSASLIISSLLQKPIEDFIGKGTGLNQEQLKHKISILKKVKIKYQSTSNQPMDILQTYGGLEIAQMVGAMQEAYQRNMIILVDGFIASAAFMILYFLDSKIKENAIFCHQSDEQAHQYILEYLNEKPILQLNLRVGEGTGCALAYPIIESAVRFLNEMSSFDDAKVSNKS